MNKTYERFELEFVRQTLKSGQVVLDVGANFGLYSVLAAQCVGVSGRVFSFEPMPHTLKHLKENTKAFPQVEIIPFAVGSRAGRVPMQFSSQYAGCAHVSLDKDKSTDSVPLISLDLFLKERGIPAPDFVKIDVEGFEDEVLKGFVECLSPKTILLCELNPATFKRSFKEPGEFLSYLGNRFRRVDFIHETTGQLLKLQSIQDLRGQLIANLVLQL